MKASELREMTIKDINAKIDEINSRLAETKISVLQGSEKNVSLVGKMRREVAVLMTVKREKERNSDVS